VKQSKITENFAKKKNLLVFQKFSTQIMSETAKTDQNQEHSKFLFFFVIFNI